MPLGLARRPPDSESLLTNHHITSSRSLAGGRRRGGGGLAGSRGRGSHTGLMKEWPDLIHLERTE